MPPIRIRPRREDEPAQGPARRRPLRRLRGGRTRPRRGAPGGHVDLIHPHSKRDVVDALRTASAAETRVLIVGGRQHIDKGNPSEVDAELWTTLLDGRVGGVVATGGPAVRHLRLGTMRDTVVEMEAMTGDVRLIKSGVRTVKNAT